MLTTALGICNWEDIDASTMRKIFRLSWGGACKRHIGASTKVMSNIFKMTL